MQKMSIRLPVNSQMRVRVQTQAYEMMQDLAFQHSGTIFGGYVRDHIISEHYTCEFAQKHGASRDHSRFWDHKFCPETKHRLLLPSDMDVTFKTMRDADNFIDAIRQTREYRHVNIVDVTPGGYYCAVVQSMRRVVITIIIGEVPFLSSGTLVSVKADVIVPKQNILLQPPFNNLDMLCNGFIMTKDGTSFSQNTGTVMDNYPLLRKTQVTLGIIKDMIEFKTYLCFTRNTSRRRMLFNIIAFKRIEKMLAKKQCTWTFLNMPFIVDTYKKSDSTQDTEPCCICYSELEDADNVAFTTSKKNDGTEVMSSKMHYTCWMKNLHHQCRRGSYQWENGRAVFRCPFRNIIDFEQCQHDINNIYI